MGSRAILPSSITPIWNLKPWTKQNESRAIAPGILTLNGPLRFRCVWCSYEAMSRIAPEWLVRASDLASIVDPSGETSGYVRDIDRQKLASHGIENETMIWTGRIVDRRF